MSRSTDPHEIIPDGFLEQWDADTIQEALKTVERIESSTPRDDRERCPECASIRVQTKHTAYQFRTGRKEPYKCDYCNAHFHSKLAPRSEFDPDTPVCPNCQSELIDISFRTLGVVCRECGGKFEQAAEESEVAV